MQIGAGLLKGAFAWGLTKMMVGAASSPPPSLCKTGDGGRRKGHQRRHGRAAIRGEGGRGFAANTKKFVDTVTKGNPISNAMGAVTGLIQGLLQDRRVAAVTRPHAARGWGSCSPSSASRRRRRRDRGLPRLEVG
jgi:hypothetical protein